LSLNLAGCTISTGAASCNPAKGVFPNSSTITENIPVALDNIGTSNNVIGKIDYQLNSRNTIDGEYFFGNANTDTPTSGAAPWWINGNHSRTQMTRGVWVFTPNSSWVNDVRFGWNRYALVDYNAECTRQVGQPDYAQLGFVSGANPPSPMCGFPIVNIGRATPTASRSCSGPTTVRDKHCIDAANGEAVNAAMNAQVPGSSSGLASLQRLGCYVSPNGRSLILPPVQGTFGTMGKDALFATAFYEWDFSLSKRWRLRDRVGVQFRAEFFNFLNNRTYAGIGSITNPATFGLATSAPNASNPINGTGGPREVQWGWKATF
jgi:hypothetical protein